ncbi:hypothetical protein Tco_1310539 [Tanacetum coccineum]
MASMGENVIAAGAKTRPPMLEKGMYDSWKTRIILYIHGKENGEMLKDPIENDLAGEDKLRYDNDIKAINILLLGLLVDIYTLINHYQTAKEIWDHIKELMKGTKMIKQERQSMIYDGFDRFTYELGESIHSYYLRFKKLINDMRVIPITMSPMQINTKFINHLQPEWSRFVTTAKQAKDLHSVNFDQLYAFLKHNEKDAKEVREMRQRFLEPLALLENNYNSPPSYNNHQSHYAPTVVQQPPTFQPDTGLAIPTFLLTDDPIASLNKAMIFLNSNVQGRQSQGYAGNAGNNQASGVQVINIVGNAGANQPRVVRCYNCNGEAQEAGVVLNEEQQDFLADSLEETDDSIANAIFMANLSHVGSLNDDMVELRDDSNKDFELKGKSNVISYTDYMLTIGNDEDNYVPPPVQKNDMMLSVIEQMKSQVEKCNMVNQESKSVNESLTSELKRYTERVILLEYVEESFERYEKNISEIVDLEKAKKKLENIVFKVGQSAQTMHMLTKPQNFYDETHKTALGYQNPLYLSQARWQQPALYNGNVFIAKHNLVSVCDSEETLILAEDSRLKMLEKQTVGFITEVKEMKDIFKQMEDEVDQCSMAKKSFEIEKKQLLINNDQLLEENITSDIMCTYFCSLNEVDNCE